ncbi:hypothetical protein LWM68_30745 [Niabella sp. W65]|nr:hypothetical protein [Niabella sp. W65]MCH7366754.1 hypothetical protein [Niabella sp. W65]
MGNPFPRATGGIVSNVQWNGFMLITQVNYTLIRDVLNAASASDLANFSNNIFGGTALPRLKIIITGSPMQLEVIVEQ